MTTSTRYLDLMEIIVFSMRKSPEEYAAIMVKSDFTREEITKAAELLDMDPASLAVFNRGYREAAAAIVGK